MLPYILLALVCFAIALRRNDNWRDAIAYFVVYVSLVAALSALALLLLWAAVNVFAAAVATPPLPF